MDKLVPLQEVQGYIVGNTIYYNGDLYKILAIDLANQLATLSPLEI